MSLDKAEGPLLILVQYLGGYNPRAGVQTITSALISRASAIQRAGRAGRTQPGVCHRLYTVETHDHNMLEYTPPAIMRLHDNFSAHPRRLTI